jgi:hypothetical protein
LEDVKVANETFFKSAETPGLNRCAAVEQKDGLWNPSLMLKPSRRKN